MNQFIELKDEIFSHPKESWQLEYKKSQTSLSKDIWSTYSAFANTKGGIIILGVEEIPDGYRVVGVDKPEMILRDFWNLIHDKKKVSANLLSNEDVITLKVAGKSIIQIKVPKASFERRPIYLNGNKTNTYIRTDDGDRKADDNQFKYLIIDSQNDIDTELLNNYTLDDLNTKTIQEYRELLYKNTQEQKYLDYSDEELLINLGVLKKDRMNSDNVYKLTTGGLLFFGKYHSITDRFKKFQLDYFKKKSSLDSDWLDRVSTGDMNYPEMNIFSFYTIVIEKFALAIPDTFRQSQDMTRGSYKSDLLLSLKEALVNVLMHAYYDSDHVIKIADYDDYIEFYNPGEMKVSKEEFIHGSYSVTRNPIISTLFRRVGIAEKAGSGGPRIIDAATKNSLKAPDIDTYFDATTIKIWKINMKDSLKGYTDIEQLIILYLMDHGQAKIKDIQKNSGYSDYKIRKTVTSLVQQGTLLNKGNGKSTIYMLNSTEELGIIANKRILKRIETELTRK
ncbi:RNA-binding domain-containing protein [Enterococcus faecalis]